MKKDLFSVIFKKCLQTQGTVKSQTKPYLHDLFSHTHIENFFTDCEQKALLLVRYSFTKKFNCRCSQGLSTWSISILSIYINDNLKLI